MQNKTPNSTRRSISSRRLNGAKERHRTEVSSGGLVFKKTPNGVYFAMVKDSYGKWAFPKGHVRGGESYKDGAIREIIVRGQMSDVKETDVVDVKADERTDR